MLIYFLYFTFPIYQITLLGLYVVCLTMLSVAHVVHSDWKVKHPISEREFGLSLKMFEIRYQTQC